MSAELRVHEALDINQQTIILSMENKCIRKLASKTITIHFRQDSKCLMARVFLIRQTSIATHLKSEGFEMSKLRKCLKSPNKNYENTTCIESL